MSTRALSGLGAGLSNFLRMLSTAPQPVNSKGHSFSTIQGAVDDLAGDGWVYIPDGTYSENVVVDEADVMLWGESWNVIVDGGTSGHAINMSGARGVIFNLQAKTTAGSGNNYEPIRIGANCLCIFCWSSQSDRYGILAGSAGGIVAYCLVESADGSGLRLNARAHAICNEIISPGAHGISVASGGDDSIMAENYISGAGDDGIQINANAENCVINCNRITGSANEAIDDDSGTSTETGNDTT